MLATMKQKQEGHSKIKNIVYSMPIMPIIQLKLSVLVHNWEENNCLKSNCFPPNYALKQIILTEIKRNLLCL